VSGAEITAKPESKTLRYRLQHVAAPHSRDGGSGDTQTIQEATIRITITTTST